MSDKGVKRWLVLPDLHCPVEDRRTMDAVLAYAHDERWDGVLQIGDFVDLNCISRWSRKVERERAGQTVQKDYERSVALLDEIQAAIRNKNTAARTVILEGNHDFRAEQYVNEFPMFEGILEIERGLGFKQRGVEWVRSWSRGDIFRLGHAHFIHGRFTNKYHAAKHVDNYGTNIFYGHTHDIQEYGKVLHGADKTIKGKSLGCLCDYKQHYMKGAPSNWQQAITVFWVQPNGFFQDVTVPIFRHRFIGPTNGVEYNGGRRK